MPNRDEKSQLHSQIATFAIFRGLEGFQLDFVIRASLLVHYKSGALIYGPQDYFNGLFVILDGTVQIAVNERKNITLGAGQYFGEYSLIERRRHHSPVVSTTDTRIMVLPPEVFDSLLRQSHQFSNNLLRNLIQRLNTKDMLELALLEKSDRINEQNKEINDSIEYAGIIQRALLPNQKLLRLKFNTCFLLFLPYQKVSGDFYWFAQRDNEYLVALSDCAGHGVPGGLISIMGIAYLNEIVNAEQQDDPGRILTRLHEKLRQAFHDTEEGIPAHEEMDIALIAINFEQMTLRYAGARNPAYIAHGGELIETRPNNAAVGNRLGETVFESQTLPLSPGDTIYLATDGIADQLGGPQGRRYGQKGLREMLTQVSRASIYRQREIAQQLFDDWRGAQPQVDDVSLLGIQI